MYRSSESLYSKRVQSVHDVQPISDMYFFCRLLFLHPSFRCRIISYYVLVAIEMIELFSAQISLGQVGSGDRTREGWLNQCTCLGLIYCLARAFVAFSLAMVCLYVFARHPFMSIVISFGTGLCEI